MSTEYTHTCRHTCIHLYASMYVCSCIHKHTHTLRYTQTHRIYNFHTHCLRIQRTCTQTHTYKILWLEMYILSVWVCFQRTTWYLLHKLSMPITTTSFPLYNMHAVSAGVDHECACVLCWLTTHHQALALTDGLAQAALLRTDHVASCGCTYGILTLACAWAGTLQPRGSASCLWVCSETLRGFTPCK
jgi:hypothetical protein